MRVCNCSMFYCTLLYVHSSIAIILMGKRELIALLNLSSWRLVMVERLFLAVPWGFLQFVIVVFPDHTHLLFLHRKTTSFCKISKIHKRNILPQSLSTLHQYNIQYGYNKGSLIDLEWLLYIHLSYLWDNI